MAKFYTLRIQDAKLIEGKEGLKIFGVRIAKFLPNGWVHFDGTTPSDTLLFGAKKLEKDNEWNEKTFREFYLKNFMQEMKISDKAKEEMRQMMKVLDLGQDVYYACYCQNPSLCHRNIIAQLIKRKGYETEEIKK